MAEKHKTDKQSDEIIGTLRNFNFDPENIKVFMDSLKTPEYGSRNVVKHYFEPNKEGNIVIGIISDTHLGHRDSDMTVLHTAYDQFKKAKVNAVYHGGEILEGLQKPAITHPHERFAHSLDDQVEFLEKHYPKIKGVNTYFLEGKNLQTFHKGAKKKDEDVVPPATAITEARPDLIPLGVYEADVKFSKNALMRVIHADQTVTYAISYYPQKEVLSLSGGTKPDLLVVGGTHYMYNVPEFRGVPTYLAGTTQRQTAYMRRKKRPAMLGAFILELEMDKEKHIKDIGTTVLPFY